MVWFLITGSYLIIVFTFNAVLQIGISWRGKFLKSKKYKGKKSPIYKLVNYKFDNYYQIQKWVLRYRDADERWSLYFIPFVCLFQIYRYDLEDTLGYFSEEYISKVKDLEVEYEDTLVINRKEWKETQTAEDRLQSRISILNTEFNNNYRG